MIKPVYLGLSILKTSKTLMYEFWNGHKNQSTKTMQTKFYGYRELSSTCKNKRCLSNPCKRCEKDLTSSYEFHRSLPINKNKKMIGLMKDELGGTIMIEGVVLKPKMYN